MVDQVSADLKRSFSRRRLVAGTTATAAALAASRLEVMARSGGAAPGSARVLAQDIQPGGTLTYGLGFDIDGTLDPGVTHFDSTIRVTLNICEPLVWMPSATEIAPGLAESWEVSEDGLEYTFKLKQGVTFHDGTPFNAEAVQFTFDRIVQADKMAATPEAATPDPATVIVAGQAHDQIGTYDHSEIIDDHTIKMVLSRPFSPFLTGLNGYLGIVSPTAVRTMGLAEFARAPVGTGPFRFKEWVEADHVTIERNPDYNWGSSVFGHQGPAYFDEIIYKVIPDAAVRTGTLLSGETQYIDELDPLQSEDVSGDEALEIIRQGQPGSGWVLLVNQARPERPVADVKVRQALEYAIDKEAFNEAVFAGSNEPASSPLMKVTFGYDPATESVYTYDKAKAESLLEEAGWVLNGDIREKDGQRLELYFPIIDRPRDNAMATAIQGSFREIGIDLTVEPMERGAYTQTWKEENNYDFSFMWFSYADPDVLRTIFYSKNIGAFNRAQYNVPEVDTMLEEAAASSDPEVRMDLYSQIQMKVLQDAVVIPLADSITYNAKQKRLQGEVLDYLASYVWMNDAHFAE
ncbi:MAG: ABC transporter, substrate-binding protein (cluster 5, nickel/peptides/opines) [uncultured Thermomicrobiales bacterium]|uniref:ABC transporter, substrate-binding protein (Cluster 5, nickel/peptides/opines) n=1 Tax=uncultured Thermomicrobiales bacterium TaxID=1645740 RepID=A0A6J4UIU8_9BACT|nr:MAG: ABC transporter, substrate-binding protein (cluster 5, nickel/peptides/opines) [uncultured Thermomicrobiales bacterium]